MDHGALLGYAEEMSYFLPTTWRLSCKVVPSAASSSKHSSFTLLQFPPPNISHICPPPSQHGLDLNEDLGNSQTLSGFQLPFLTKHPRLTFG